MAYPPLYAEVLALSDELEFAAIQTIHSQLDDNSDGKVDRSESEEVLILWNGIEFVLKLISHVFVDKDILQKASLLSSIIFSMGRLASTP